MHKTTNGIKTDLCPSTENEDKEGNIKPNIIRLYENQSGAPEMKVTTLQCDQFQNFGHNPVRCKKPSRIVKCAQCHHTNTGKKPNHKNTRVTDAFPKGESQE